MTVLLIVIYLILLSIPFLKKNKDFFSPPILFVITMSFYTLPDVFNILINGEYIYIKEVSFTLKTTPVFAIQRFLFLQILYVLFYYFGFNIKYQNYNKYKIKRTKRIIDADRKSLNLIIVLLGLFICLVSTIIFIRDIGGYEVLLLSFSNRTQLKEETSFLQQHLGIIITLCTAFCLKYNIQTKSRILHVILLSALIVIGFISQTSGGGRSQFVVFILSILCYYNYWVKRVNLFSKKYLPIYFGLAVFIMFFQMLRFGGPDEISLESFFDNGDSLFESMTYVKTQLLIQNYFTNHDFWNGEVYQSLLYIFVPRLLFPDKPFIDEGGYIYNMTYDMPNILSSNFFVNSWPPFTMGITYANWGLVGIIIGGVLLGTIHGYVYKMIKKYNYVSFIMIIYIFVALKFQLTVYYIAEIIFLIIEVLFVYYFYKYACHLIKH